MRVPKEMMLTRPNIERLISPTQIMAYYSGIDLARYEGKPVKSPLRQENNPSFVVYINDGGRIFWKDYGNNDTGTVYDFVMKYHKVDFYEALKHINNDFNLGLFHKEIYHYNGKLGNVLPDYVEKKNKKELVLKRRKMGRRDLEYWARYGVTPEILKKYNVYALESVQIGKLIIKSSYYNPMYVYVFYSKGMAYYKIYRPFERKGRKWISSAPAHIIQGLEQVNLSAKHIVITKSLKDVMVLASYGINSIAFQSESYVPHINVLKRIEAKYEKVYLLYDFDLAGVRTVNTIRKLIKCEFLFLQKWKTRKNGMKDIADMKHKSGDKYIQPCITKRLK